MRDSYTVPEVVYNSMLKVVFRPNASLPTAPTTRLIAVEAEQSSEPMEAPLLQPNFETSPLNAEIKVGSADPVDTIAVTEPYGTPTVSSKTENQTEDIKELVNPNSQTEFLSPLAECDLSSSGLRNNTPQSFGSGGLAPIDTIGAHTQGKTSFRHGRSCAPIDTLGGLERFERNIRAERFGYMCQARREPFYFL
jgi:hypothetical protein